MALVEVKVPDIGDFDEVAVIELLVKPGDTVKAEQSLITVESDKASMEIPSSAAGVVKELRVKLGDKVSEGSVVLVLEAAGAAAAPAAPVSEQKQAKPSVEGSPAATESVAVAAPAPCGCHRPGGGAGARHRRLQGRCGDRGVRQARRHRQGGAEPDHGGVRQGVDGNPVVAAGVVRS
jgi:pyruvate/2-oxoglutarate dehydrogenase complex dihydrolipoamide acyltransferase (E2) component